MSREASSLVFEDIPWRVSAAGLGRLAFVRGWSNDGRRILLQLGHYGEHEIVPVDVSSWTIGEGTTDVHSCALSADGARIAVIRTSYDVELVDWTSPSAARTLTRPAEDGAEPVALALDSAAANVAIFCSLSKSSSQVRVVSTTASAEPAVQRIDCPLVSSFGDPVSITFSGEHVAVAVARPRDVALWCNRSPQTVLGVKEHLPEGSKIDHAFFSIDGRTLIVVARTAEAALILALAVPSFEVRAEIPVTIPANARIASCAASGDAAIVAYAPEPSGLFVIDVAGRTTKATAVGTFPFVHVSPDGRRVLSAPSSLSEMAIAIVDSYSA